MLLKQYAAIDLFCGAGGLTRGLLDAGIPVLAGLDYDPSCSFPYEINNKPVQFIEQDIADVKGQDLLDIFGDVKIKILVGCAPCQPFSTHTQKYCHSKYSKNWDLLLEFLRIIREIKPDIVSMENVPGLKSKDIFLEYKSGLEKLGYNVWYDTIYSPDYGVPQKRRRLVLLATKVGHMEMIEPTFDLDSHRTVRDQIGYLPLINAGEEHDIDSMHKTWAMSSTNLDRIKHSIPGGTWEDWDESLRAPCHLIETGQSYKSVYARMLWDEPSPTITTQFYNYGTGRFGHPDQDRALSLREGALLQSFPKNYEFVDQNEQITFTQVGKLIGNAVPVKLGEAIGKSILKYIENLFYE